MTMSNLPFFDRKDLPRPRKGRPAPDRLIGGNPRFLTWDIAQTSDGVIRSGMWEVTLGVDRSIKGTTFEFCDILSGVSKLIEDGKVSRRMTAGDAFVMHPGFIGVWKVIETTRKLWVCHD